MSKITVLSSSKKRITIGTNAEMFYPDQVVAVALICLLEEDNEITIIRSNDIEDLDECDYIVDFENSEFYDLNLSRLSGIAYADAGTIWGIYGNDIIYKLIYNSNLPCNLITGDDIEELFHNIDDEVISVADAMTNGDKCENSFFKYLDTFYPLWFSKDLDYDKAFHEALLVTIPLLKQDFLNRISFISTFEEINFRVKDENFFICNILEIPNIEFQWRTAVVKHNKTAENGKKIHFIICKDVDDEWVAFSVPSSEYYENYLITFPAELVNRSIDLAELTDIDGALFCHKHYARAKTKESIMALCYLAEKNIKK